MSKNWEAREAKLAKKKNAMKVNGRGLITVTLPLLGKKARQAKERNVPKTS